MSFMAVLIAACSPHELSIPPESMEDNFGREILVVIDDSRPKAGATFAHGVPYIYMNRTYMRNFPEQTQWFIFYHEIGHHKLDHFLFAKDPKKAELEADCWSVKYLINKHDYKAKDISVIRHSLVNQFNQGDDQFHYSGSKRAKALRQDCLK